MTSTQRLHDTMSLRTTVPQAQDDPDLMGTLVQSHVRWKRVHEQAQLIAARNAEIRRKEAECALAEKRARAAIHRLTTTARHRRRRFAPWMITALMVAAACVIGWLAAG